MKTGKVYLAGAGPGDPNLLTIKTLEVLKKADVIVYDRLVTNDMLSLVPEKVERVYVGKSPGEHYTPQKRIIEILVSEARKGKVVVRLKGGDPFLFGRGGEEAQELRRAGVEFEVVPGVASALAAPAYAGIPVTHREYSSSLAIVTGHEDPTKTESHINWDKLATSVDTLVVLMAVARLENVVEGLLKGGRDAATSVAIIERGTTKNQRITIGTLRDIIQKARERRIRPPAIIVVGDVVKLQKELSWFKG